MARDEADPVALPPDAVANRDFRVELNADLEIAFETGLRDWQSSRSDRLALETTIHHSVQISLLRSLHCWGGSSISSKFEDRALGVVFLHRIQVGRAFEQMSSLTAGVLRTDGLAVDALRRQTLVDVSRWRLRS